MTTISPAPGHVGNLSPTQERLLRALWAKLFEYFGEKPLDINDASSQSDLAGLAKADSAASEAGDSVDAAAAALEGVALTDSPKSTTSASSPKPAETLREAFWGVVQADHPDGMVLRFLRARKWNVDRALEMMLTALRWRIETQVDQIINEGEGGLDDSILRKGISFLHGEDRKGRPIIITRVCLHRKEDQTVEEMTKFLVWTIETVRLVFKAPTETATIIFDLSDFTLANMDFNFVKILIRCLEAYYPESLGSLLIYNAPWIFSGIWRMISPLLDSVVASKINFVNNKKQFTEFIDPEHLVDWLGGSSKFKYEYVGPAVDENHRIQDAAGRQALLDQRSALANELEAATREWIKLCEAKDAEAVDVPKDNAEVKAIQDKRQKVVEEMRDVCQKLDPFIRARTFYHRIGVIEGHGQIDWDPMFSNGYALK
ncbi:CRAL-TRIO domain-containing protein [Dimargaris cristalligena]|uniref:CRAL-TRIO domain-containing protein n=1 Tax=Dimargaris cristalligena TaxID=215637 RepID=A0A4P9ZLC5_9FUNG|nr:CRAL-TRIO domain-containing protein [Dimargaris cristalligena]|eukprot:RKP34094.1 CRAL-TRIO domain-containing protein [Dimargaris cristalligena]